VLLGSLVIGGYKGGYNKMITNSLRNSAVLLLGFLLFLSPALALGDDDDNDGSRTRFVDCADPDASLQRVVDRLTDRPGDRPATIVIRGSCTEDVTIKRDNLTLAGDGGTVHGTITILGARRVVIRGLTITGSGAGVVGTDNAAFTVEDSFLHHNDTDGIVVDNGAHATITRNRGRGIHVNHGASAEITKNTIEDNRSDGIGVYNDAYASVRENLIQRNGRPDPICDAGIQLSRARVRANGNIIRDNGCAAIEVFNSSDYRTGSFLNSVEQPDNEFAFEQIEGVGPGKRAVDLGQASYVDLRQVNVRGSVIVGGQSMLQVRGDDVGPNLQCSTIDTAGGVFQVSGRNGLLRLRTVNITPPGSIFVFGPNGQIDGGTLCP
jgi:hypothetical protein